VRKTYEYKLKPTRAQRRALDAVLWRCRTLYNTALEQRKTWWARGQGRSATYSQQKAELPDLTETCPAFAEVNAQVVQDVLLRLDHAFQACLCRCAAGETPGYPRFQGAGRSTSFT
jgi:putative transposase